MPTEPFAKKGLVILRFRRVFRNLRLLVFPIADEEALALAGYGDFLLVTPAKNVDFPLWDCDMVSVGAVFGQFSNMRFCLSSSSHFSPPLKKDHLK